ncbi:hypothetical protein KL931_002117 [Ogataea haglerorum]|nr:hypothetical protein KL931_002117 [Ogataea haglerorum]
MSPENKKSTLSLFSRSKTRLVRRSKILLSPRTPCADAFPEDAQEKRKEELEAENKMLKEQVSKQKFMILKLIDELEYMESLCKQKAAIVVDPTSPTNSFSSNASSMETLAAKNSEKEKLIKQLSLKTKLLESNVADLRSQLKSNLCEYQRSLSNLSDSVTMIKENQRFLTPTPRSHIVPSSRFLDLKQYTDTDAGETFRRLQSPPGIIPVKSSEFDSFFEGEKDYFLVLFLTAQTNQNCKLCQYFQPVYETVVRSFYESNPSFQKVFFLSVDASDNIAHFQKYNISTVPHLWIYPISSFIYKPVDSDDAYDKRIPMPENLSIVSEHYTYPITDTITQADQELRFATFLGELTQTKIVINKPMDLVLALKYCAGFFVLFRILRSRKERVLDKIRNGTAVLVLSIIAIYICFSGVNFAVQRNVPFLVKDKDGSLKYLTPGVQNMIGAEVTLSIAFQMVFSLLLWLLIQGVPRIPKENQAVGMLLFAAMLFLTYNLFTSMFKAKDPGYPFTYLYIPIF